MALGTLVVVSASFSDPGTLDTYAGSVQWDAGGELAPASVDGSTVFASTQLLTVGVHTVTLGVTDDDGGTGTSTSAEYVVVYDPDAGFVSGGGRIRSPAGACLLDAACEGMSGPATFGFVSKYVSGAKIPTGHAAFRFTAGDLAMTSESYDWLVVAGARAQFKGEASVNGNTGYGFLLTAVDGALLNGSDDLFRVKIWEIDTGVIAYDNQLGADDAASLTTAIDAGNIVIHK